MGEWRDIGWLKGHAILAPFGILAVTWVLTAINNSYQWNIWENLESMATMVDLGIVVYAIVAMIGEGGLRMVFWAYQSWKRDNEKWKTEQRAVGQAQLMSKLWEAAQKGEPFEDALKRLSREEGISTEGRNGPNR
jgi:hypothetical protein